MSEKTTVMDLVNIIIDGSSAFGNYRGLEEAAKIIRERSGTCFQEGEDKKACAYRELADSFDWIAKTRKEIYHKLHKDACDGAVDAILERFGDIDLSEKDEGEV